MVSRGRRLRGAWRVAIASATAALACALPQLARADVTTVNPSSLVQAGLSAAQRAVDAAASAGGVAVPAVSSPAVAGTAPSATGAAAVRGDALERRRGRGLAHAGSPGLAQVGSRAAPLAGAGRRPQPQHGSDPPRLDTGRAGLGAGIGSERACLGPEPAGLGSERARLGPEPGRLGARPAAALLAGRPP